MGEERIQGLTLDLVLQTLVHHSCMQMNVKHQTLLIHILMMQTKDQTLLTHTLMTQTKDQTLLTHILMMQMTNVSDLFFDKQNDEVPVGINL